MENLPGEILTNIFIRLLAKQLAQMRSVSKSWNALLSESSFVKSHLHRSIHNNDDEILLFFGPGRSFHSKPLTACRRSRSPDHELTDFIKLPLNPPSEYTHDRIIGSLDGLICFSYFNYRSHRDHVVYIWNPSLSAVLTLPPFSCPSRKYCGFQIHLRFGFDPKTDDYKVFKHTTLFHRPKNLVGLDMEVYSMRKGCWELITQKLIPSHVQMLVTECNNEVCEDGNLHWVGYTISEWKTIGIVAFDLGAETFREIPLPETFREIPLPDSLLNHGRLHVSRVFGGKLCVMSRDENDKYEVWVMEKYRVADSWVKRYAFSQFTCNLVPWYGFIVCNKFIIKAENDHFALYDPIADKCETFKITGGGYGVNKIVEYVDSLVWVAPA